MQRQLNGAIRIIACAGVILFCFLMAARISAAGVPGYRLYVARFLAEDLIIIDSATHKDIGKIHLGFASNPVEMMPSHDRSRLYVSARGFDEIEVVDLKTGKIKSRIKVGTHPHSMKISPDGRYLVVSHNQDEYASVIDLAAEKVVGTPRISDRNSGASGVAVTPDSRFAYFTASYLNEIDVVDLQKMERVYTIKDTPGCTEIVMPQEGALAYFGSHRNRLSILDTHTNKVVGEVPVGDTPAYVTITADGKRAFVPNYWSHTVTVVDLSNKKALTDINVGREPTYSALSPDGKFLFVVNYGNGYEDGSISVIDVNSLKVIDTIETLSYPRAVTVLPVE